METRKETVAWHHTEGHLKGTPAWYQKLALATPDNETPHYETASLSEFCGRFNLTEGKALSEIRRCKLWRCGNETPVQINTAEIYARRRGEQIPEKERPYTIPLPEFDRYAAIIEAEKRESEPSPTHLALHMNKRHPAFSSELEAAVSCWMAIFADAPPGTVATHTKDKTLSWLTQNCPKLEESQHRRIATLLTPDVRKAGGAPPTPE